MTSCSNCIHRMPDDELGPSCAHPRALEKSPVGLDLEVAIKRFCGEERVHREELPTEQT